MRRVQVKRCEYAGEGWFHRWVSGDFGDGPDIMALVEMDNGTMRVHSFTEVTFLKPPRIPVEARNCENCKHGDVELGYPPCNECDGTRHWEANL